MIPDYFEFTLPTKVIYGPGAVNALEGPAARFKGRKALIVTDAVLVKSGLSDKVKKGFTRAGIKISALFDNVPPNSTIKTVQECADLGKKKKCDMVIAVGGGSVIDTAKVANILITRGGKVEEHMGAYLLNPHDTLQPFVVVPTTAGTGSEVTKVAVIADPDNDVKLPFTEDQFLPDLAILDPEMTLSMPPRLTAFTGMDALVHAIEAYVDKEWSPASDALALHAVKLISDNILKACSSPEDIQARGAMQVGAFLAGAAFSHSMVGMVHGISHALGGVYHIPHGLANALILPEVMEFNLDARVERYADIALALGISFPTVIHDSQSIIKSGAFDLLSKAARWAGSDALKELVDSKTSKAKNFTVRKLENFGFVDEWIRKQAAVAGIQKIRTLNQQLAFLTGMPLNLKDAGIDDELEKMDLLADTAMEDGAMLYNPVEPDRDAVIRIVKKVYHAKDKPLEVPLQDLKTMQAHAKDKKKKGQIFDSSDMIYQVLAEFYETLKQHESIGPEILNTDLCIQFIYKNPDAVITIDATGDEIQIIRGEFSGRPQVTMSMDADLAHKFWHGKVNLVTALTRRQVTAKGNVAKTLKLLPILKPAYEIYPVYLEKRGLGHLIIV